MPTIRPIQPSFSGGEYSPAIYARVDINKYHTGLKKLRNFIIHPTGGASNRPGTRYVATAKSANTACIVQEFIFSQTQKYILEIGDEYIRFYTSGAQINVTSTDYASWSSGTAYEVGDYVTYNGSTVYYAIQAGTNQQPDTQTDYWTAQTIYEIPAPYASTDLSDLRFETSGDTIFITHPDYQTRLLQRYGNTDWRLSLYEPDDGPFMPENTDESISLNVSAVTGSVSLSAASAYFDTLHVGAYFKLKHYVDSQKAEYGFTSVIASSSISCFRTWRFVTHGTWTGDIAVEKSTDGGTTWTTLRSYKGFNDVNVDDNGTEDVEGNPYPFLVRMKMTGYNSGTCNAIITTDGFFQDGVIKITDYHSTTSCTATVIQDVGATTNTTSWNEGSWSDYRGWPAHARFYQDRLVFAATYDEPMTLWMTQTANYFSFFRYSPLLDTDGITTRLPSRQLNVINGLVAFKRLVALTSASIWSIGPVSGSTMTPTSFTTEVEEYTGSSGINPVVIGNEAFYMQEHGHVVRNISFDFSSDGFVGADVNILSEHLFDRWTITDMVFQRDPNRIVWMLRSDGKLVGLTYLKDQEVIGFHWHDTGVDYGDTFESIAVIPSDGFDELWVVASRENGYFIERMTLRMESVDCSGEQQYTAQNQIFLDSAVSYDNPIDISSITVNQSSGEVTITLASGHGLSVGDTVFIDCVKGMTELNGKRYTLTCSPT